MENFYVDCFDPAPSPSPRARRQTSPRPVAGDLATHAYRRAEQPHVARRGARRWLSRGAYSRHRPSPASPAGGPPPPRRPRLRRHRHRQAPHHHHASISISRCGATGTHPMASARIQTYSPTAGLPVERALRHHRRPRHRRCRIRRRLRRRHLYTRITLTRLCRSSTIHHRHRRLPTPTIHTRRIHRRTPTILTPQPSHSHHPHTPQVHYHTPHNHNPHSHTPIHFHTPRPPSPPPPPRPSPIPSPPSRRRRLDHGRRPSLRPSHHLCRHHALPDGLSPPASMPCPEITTTARLHVLVPKPHGTAAIRTGLYSSMASHHGSRRDAPHRVRASSPRQGVAANCNVNPAICSQ